MAIQPAPLLQDFDSGESARTAFHLNVYDHIVVLLLGGLVARSDVEVRVFVRTDAPLRDTLLHLILIFKLVHLIRRCFDLPRL